MYYLRSEKDNHFKLYYSLPNKIPSLCRSFWISNLPRFPNPPPSFHFVSWHLGEITDSERQAVWETLLLRSVGEVVKHGEIVRVAAYFRVGRQVVERIWRRGINSMGDRVAAVVKSRKSACGRKKVDRAELCERIAAVPVNERENQYLLQRASNMSCYLVQQLIKEGYIRRALRQTHAQVGAPPAQGQASTSWHSPYVTAL
uniref:Transposase n=1 Tax=Phytophthora infestans TaxID=4787 RepID=Q5MGB5_PHYIN|nr:transposase [Phytophthora infestans]